MTYEELIKLKFGDGRSTQELFQAFPRDRIRIQEIALMDLSDEALRGLISEKRLVRKVIRLKKILPAG